MVADDQRLVQRAQFLDLSSQAPSTLAGTLVSGFRDPGASDIPHRYHVQTLRSAISGPRHWVLA